MTETPTARPPQGRRLALLCVAAVGVVYGDIGTSPIYAIREALHSAYGVEPVGPNVLGVLSLIFWSLIIVISIKYLYFVMRADNEGEGGIIALTALVMPETAEARRGAHLLVLAGLFGAALLYGDSMITPAISVLSAVEGLEVATPFFQPYILVITVAILVALFSFQSRGTARIGTAFGPVMMIWFATLAVLGLVHIAREPHVLGALSPTFAIGFFRDNGSVAFLVMGSVFLVVTGGEALYADMGHFGTRPIRLTWFGFVLPALLLNYFGQGALLLREPAALAQPFYLMAPSWALYPLVGLTTVATVIASQAVISGAFSLTRQAVHLGYLPRLRVEHTSVQQEGQIYLPVVNWGLMLACVGLVLGFRSSSALAAAYGVAVTTDMVFTTLLFAVVAWSRWGWKPALVIMLVSGLLTIDLSFWGANLHKIPHGGWFPLLVAALVFLMMTTWKRGRELLGARLRGRELPIDLFLEDVKRNPPTRVPGTAVFFDSNPEGTPPALLHNIKHNWVLHERVILLNLRSLRVPHAHDDRFEVHELGEGFCRVRIQVGFAEDVDVPALLAGCEIPGGPLEPMRTSYFLGRERLLSARRSQMPSWRRRLFAFMSRNAIGVSPHFNLPPNRVVEVGMQIEI